MRRFFSFLVGTMTGAVVGAAVALLLAPMSGEELQNRARDRMTNLADDIRDAYAARVAQLEAELEDLRKPKKSEEKAS
jgi:gas vesicle protein